MDYIWKQHQETLKKQRKKLLANIWCWQKEGLGLFIHIFKSRYFPILRIVSDRDKPGSTHLSFYCWFSEPRWRPLDLSSEKHFKRAQPSSLEHLVFEKSENKRSIINWHQRSNYLQYWTNRPLTCKSFTGNHYKQITGLSSIHTPALQAREE